MTVIIRKPEPTAEDLALLRLDLSDEELQCLSRVGQLGPGALTPPDGIRQVATDDEETP